MSHSGHFGGGFSLHFKERKAEGFSQNHAMQFGKVPTLKEGGAESRVKQLSAGNACAIFYIFVMSFTTRRTVSETVST